MNDNHFLDEAQPPVAAAIESVLGAAYPWYLGLLGAAEGFEQDWKHYGRKYGWKLKVHDGEKTLFELTVGDSGFRIGMAVRERELVLLRESPEAATGIEDLIDPAKAKEGWGIRLAIDDEARYGQALALVKAVASIRRKG